MKYKQEPRIGELLKIDDEYVMLIDFRRLKRSPDFAYVEILYREKLYKIESVYAGDLGYLKKEIECHLFFMSLR